MTRSSIAGGGGGGGVSVNRSSAGGVFGGGRGRSISPLRSTNNNNGPPGSPSATATALAGSVSPKEGNDSGRRAVGTSSASPSTDKLRKVALGVVSITTMKHGASDTAAAQLSARQASKIDFHDGEGDDAETASVGESVGASAVLNGGEGGKSSAAGSAVASDAGNGGAGSGAFSGLTALGAEQGQRVLSSSRLLYALRMAERAVLQNSMHAAQRRYLGLATQTGQNQLYCAGARGGVGWAAAVAESQAAEQAAASKRLMLLRNAEHGGGGGVEEEEENDPEAEDDGAKRRKQQQQHDGVNTAAAAGGGVQQQRERRGSDVADDTSSLYDAVNAAASQPLGIGGRKGALTDTAAATAVVTPERAFEFMGLRLSELPSVDPTSGGIVNASEGSGSGSSSIAPSAAGSGGDAAVPHIEHLWSYWWSELGEGE